MSSGSSLPLRLVKAAEQAERFDDMIKYMEIVLAGSSNLNVEERNLLSVAFTKAIRARRNSWRSISHSLEGETNASLVNILKNYLHVIEKEIETIIKRVISIVNDSLLPDALDSEAKVFYYKMIGDCNRYRAELRPEGVERKTAVEQALNAFQLASDTAVKELPPLNAIRLGLALNYSVFLREIEKNIESSIKIARCAFDDAIVEMDVGVDDAQNHDSSLILKILGEKLQKWDEKESVSVPLDVEGM